MEVIRSYSLGAAHESAVMRVVLKGKYMLTEDNEETIELQEPLNVFVATPVDYPMVSPKNKFGERAMTGYADQLLNDSENDFVYTYHDRLFKYPSYKNEYFIDQINSLIVNLKKNPSSRRAQAITWIPDTDLMCNSPPCLQRLQFLIRNNKLNMSCEFRSQDILSAMGANMYALVNLQLFVAERLNIDIGWFSSTAVNAHIYFKRDIEELLKYYNPYQTGEQLCFELRTHK